jgi:hypothetical protein|nr:MAG TPA: Two-component Enterococcus faecalis cytolysin (EFC) [Caudoviricetes sp.]
MKAYSTVCGAAFEDLSAQEMMDFDGGGTGVLTPITVASSLACGVGASISLISVGVTVLIFG